MKFEEIKKALDTLKEGKLILVTDDENRENEGDLICSARAATTENVNFMASYAKGLILYAYEQEYSREAHACAYGRKQYG